MTLRLIVDQPVNGVGANAAVERSTAGAVLDARLDLSILPRLDHPAGSANTRLGTVLLANNRVGDGRSGSRQGLSWCRTDAVQIEGDRDGRQDSKA
ncbi:MAG: hypothetical protein LBC97_10275 [Bifidobacteriaceae bacterium]|nr:hypothetical protein [Bifidobacteriaceae bacterium]